MIEFRSSIHINRIYENSREFPCLLRSASCIDNDKRAGYGRHSWTVPDVAALMGSNSFYKERNSSNRGTRIWPGLHKASMHLSATSRGTFNNTWERRGRRINMEIRAQRCAIHFFFSGASARTYREKMFGCARARECIMRLRNDKGPKSCIGNTEITLCGRYRIRCKFYYERISAFDYLFMGESRYIIRRL